MKYIVVLGDGMSDYAVPELGGRTPLQAAKKPCMDFIARHGVMGLVRTVPESVQPASDTANLSVMGFDPEVYYTGRSPIEAVSMGVEVGDDDIAYRCNLVTLSDAERYEDKLMLDYSSDEIPSDEAATLIGAVNEQLLPSQPARLISGDIIDLGSAQDAQVAQGGSPCGNLSESAHFYPGISYRHCMIWNGRGAGPVCVPPHDILTRRIGEYLPADADGSGDAHILNKLMKESYAFLSEHEVNKDRVRRGLLPANSLWLWGQGGRLTLSSFYDKYKVSGAVISAVDLVKGIGISAGLRSIDVDGATGTLNTNYRGKAEAALAALEGGGCDFVYVHIEAPDECGHRNEIDNKVKSIEYIDEHVVSVLLERLRQIGDEFSILVLPDHPTPLSLRTHARDPVPFALYTSSAHKDAPSAAGYDEVQAARTGLLIDPGHTLMDHFIANTLKY
ncbi:MAG: cofactor-independent phosphoglycerate mutase [Oscillospiraceae bacterium]|nr:cofactor-independent phosphoglycerate mutase [Oscillospiraceae bacterium]